MGADKRREDAIRKAASKARINMTEKSATRNLIDWKALWWIGLLPLVGIGALSAYSDDVREQLLGNSRVYNYFKGDNK